MIQRIRSNSTAVAVTIKYYRAGNEGGPQVGPGVGIVKSMTDEVIPRFFARSKAGEVFFNPMTYVEQSFGATSYSPLSFTCIAPTLPEYGIFRNWSGSVVQRRLGNYVSPVLNGASLPVGVLAVDPSTREDLITEASTQALANRGQSQNNLWESIAELDKSLKMAPDMLLEVRNIVKKTARVQYKKDVKSLYTNTTASRLATLSKTGLVGRKVNAAANLYLAYRYGISPLLNDISGILSGAAKAAGRVRQTSRGAARTTVSAADVAYEDPLAIGGYVRIYYNLKIQRELTMSVRAMSLDEYNIGALFNMGFSAKGLAGLPWELTPYSFVVDWVANVGDLLYAVMPSSVARALGSCVVIESDEYLRATTNSTANPQTASQGAPDIGTYSGHIITRERIPGALVPGLVIRSDFKMTNMTRVADAASLLLQTMKHPYR